jgi:CubicO group peptidase (beta-lactamase class C family)
MFGAKVKPRGRVARGFEAVSEAFMENFARTDAFREIGAAVTVMHHGKVVVDLWSGLADPAHGRPWRGDTLVNVWSASKGAVACAVARLVDQGAMRYDQPIAEIWPEFAQNGKAGITIAQVMSHQSGLNGFVEPTSITDQYDWAACCAKLARQAPLFEPGAVTSYHAMTFGWLAGEIVRRVSGRSVGEYLRREIAGPLKADVHIGLPAADDRRVARIFAPRSPPEGGDISPIAAMALQNPIQDAEAPNARAWRAAQIPAANGQASARGLARLYAPLSLGGARDGVQVLSQRGLAALYEPATSGGRQDLLMGFEDSWSMGMMRNPVNAYGSGLRTFGHSGWGGSFGCADPDAELAIGYVCNQMGSELIFDPRSMALVKAITACAAGR